MNPLPDTVTIPVRLYEAMAACYYGGDKDYWDRTERPKPSASILETHWPDEGPVNSPSLPVEHYTPRPVTNDIFAGYEGNGVRVQRRDLAATSDGVNTEDADADATDAAE
jgi:hypothetical protein